LGPNPLVRGARLEEHALDSTALRARRGMTVYRPPGVDGTLPGCVLADGGAVPGFARVLEPAAGTAMSCEDREPR
jgi:hypothetical protein